MCYTVVVAGEWLCHVEESAPAFVDKLKEDGVDILLAVAA